MGKAGTYGARPGAVQVIGDSMFAERSIFRENGRRYISNDYFKASEDRTGLDVMATKSGRI